jgi:hypothetical protein
VRDVAFSPAAGRPTVEAGRRSEPAAPQKGGGAMAKRERTQPPAEAQAQTQAEQFVANLAEEEVMLLRLRDELYDGRWDAMLADLNDRLQGKPYVFKLAHRIQDDIERIERLNRFERQNNVNLADYL